ncbi:MAG: metallophosphoesterase [Ilumatobacteraceae bacterium]
MDITTVADDLIVLHESTDDGVVAHRYDDLSPGTEYELHGRFMTTLPNPGGELLCRFTTVNDVHFGEVQAGRIDDHTDGPIQRAAPGEEPYPETMNRAAVAEMSAIDPAAVIVKGDLSTDGLPDEWSAFEATYRVAFGDRLRVVRGNHDAYKFQHGYEGDQWIELPGLTVALLDTVIPGQTTGRITSEQITWLDDHAAGSDRPVLVMGHHQQWLPSPNPSPGGEDNRSEDYFGLHPDSSDALAGVAARRHNIIGYAAGHTHRHRIRPMLADGSVPSIEIGCVKDFPGTWAEYRVHEGGVMQVVHRISTPDALRWSERCRHLYKDFGIDYEHYALGRLEDRCFTIPLR